MSCICCAVSLRVVILITYCIYFSLSTCISPWQIAVLVGMARLASSAHISSALNTTTDNGKNTTVDFPTLLKTFVDRLADRGHNSWYAIQSLQMFSPMPLDLLGELTKPGGWYTRPAEEYSVHKLRGEWLGVYHQSTGTNTNGSRSIMEEMTVDCTVDYNRFPAVLCQAKCTSTCPRCIPDPQHCHHVRYLQKILDDDSSPSWKLQARTMRLVAPDSCKCITATERKRIRRC